MCHYITPVLSPRADIDTIAEIMESYSRKLEPLTEHALSPELHPGETYYLTSRSCDCGTGIGWLTHEHVEPDYSGQVKRFRKKGWSDTKIRRWLDEMLAQHKTRDDVLLRPPADVIRWRKLIQEVLTTGSAGYIGLLLHWYDGIIEREGIDIGPRQNHSLSELDEDCLLRAEEDTLHVFRP